MKKIIGLFIVELCFVFASFAGGFPSKTEQLNINHDDIGYARQYLQESLDWNNELSSDQKDTLEEVYNFIDTNFSEVSQVVLSNLNNKVIDLITYINTEFIQNIYNDNLSVRKKVVNELVEKYIKIAQIS